MAERKGKKIRELKSFSKINVTIKLSKEEVSLTDSGEYASIMLKGGIPRGEPGQPALPWNKHYISVPWDTETVTIEAKNAKTDIIAEKVTIEPKQPEQPTILGTQIEPVGPDKELYASKKAWPETYVRFIAVRRTGGYAIAEIEICPFRYYASEGKLEIIQSLDLEVSCGIVDMKSAQPDSLVKLMRERKFADRVKEIVLNPEEVSLHQRIKETDVLKDLTLYPQTDYVIITSSALAAKFQRLASWRTLMGLRSKVVTVEDIVAGTVPDTGGTVFWETTGYEDGGTRDIAEAIRNFIKWASVNWQIEYVLLGGDNEIIPCRQALHTNTGSLAYMDINLPNKSSANQLGYSALASTEKPGKTAASVLDNDTATVWECAAGDTNPWLRLTVGTKKPVNCVDISWGSTHASSYKIQTSTDGTVWDDAYTALSCAGGNESISFQCTSANYIRLLITSGTNFSLASLKVYGPYKGSYGGVAYRMSDTITRVYLSTSLSPNPDNDPEKDMLLIKEGPHKGQVVPYNQAADSTALGWRFVTDLVAMPGTASTNATYYMEICGPSEHHGNTFQIKCDLNYIPADLYYSDIATSEYTDSSKHDWDADGNGIYGERYGGELDMVNGFSDVLLGRAPVEKAEKVDVFIDKVIQYESYTQKNEYGFPILMPSDFAVSVLLGSENWYGDTPGSLDESAAGKERIMKSFKSYAPSRWQFTRRYEDFNDVPADDKGPDLAEASKDEILTAIKQGNNVVSLSSHGSYGYLCYLSSGDLDDITSPPAIFYGNACSTNKFDVPYGEALSELTILNSSGSAVAYVGNSRFGWTGDSYIEKAFWDKMLDSGILGEMFDECKKISHDWAKYSLNLLGDPAMRVWSDRPKQLNVAHPSLTYTGSQSFEVTVTSSGSPVKNAVVCLTMPGTLFAKGVTDVYGKASINISPSVEGIMRVAVSGKNLIPYMGSVTVKKSPNICGTSVICTLKIDCGLKIACGIDIVCGTKLLCNYLLQCKKLTCIKLIGGCTGLIGGCTKLNAIESCAKLGSGELKIFEHIRDIWNIQSFDRFVEEAETPEIKETMERIPPEIKKSIEMMVKRIKEED